MSFKRTLFVLTVILFSCNIAKAQIEFGHLSSKEFSGFGFSGAFNFSMPVSDADYATVELGLSYFRNKDYNVGLVPILAGYRYTLNRSGVGLYIEPNAGYTIGGTDIYKQAENGAIVFDYNTGNWAQIKASGVTTGASIGYLFNPSEGAVRIQFNVSLRYEHTFSELSSNMFAVRITHAFSFGRRDYY